MARVVRTRRARADLIDIWEYVATENVDAADRLAVGIDRTCLMLAQHPLAGPSRDDIRPGLRYFVHREYVILYRRIEDGVEIVRVVHGRRDLFALF